MTDPEQLEQYRSMTPAARLAVWLEPGRVAMQIWDTTLSTEGIDRRLAIWSQQHEASDRRMLLAFHTAS